ncbi:spartin-like [Mercenaria mercenaria]|uniref:spartin-like n=1 Tax=Mercenaria mercenaria TaxID=6596 RepID=UPI00234F83F1|nr:spartin-like [Mercenaria mercenaria]
MEAPVQVRPPGGRSRGERSRSPRSQPSRPPPPSAVMGIRSLSDVQQCHDDAIKLIESGLSADEQGRMDDARAFYQSGLQSVTKVLAVNCEQLNGTEDDKNKAKTIQQKLNKTKLQIEYRLQTLRASEIATQCTPSAPQAMNVEEPPSYEDATRTPQDDQFVELGDSIMREDSVDSNSLTANAAEIFCIPDGVQIFFITPEGYVSAPSYPSSLKIFKFIEQEEGASNSTRPTAFLQVGDWLYPLQPGASPALQSNYGAYLFPDVSSPTPGSAVGLMVPDTLAPADRELFEEFLNSLTVLQQQGEIPSAPMETSEVSEEVRREGEEGETSTTSTKISKGLIIAAEYISWGVGKGAEKAGELLKHGSTKLRSRLKPEEQPKHVDPKVQKGIQYARKGSHVAVQVSSYIVSKLGQATMALAKEAAPHIRKQGEKLIPKSMKQTESDGKSKLDSVLEVAASGLKGFGTVYMSLEQAAKVLGKNLADETVEIVSHKYGTEVGQATGNALYATGNIGMTAYNANHLGVKAIAKRAAKDTGKAVLEDLSDKSKTPPQKPPPPGAGASGSEKKY